MAVRKASRSPASAISPIVRGSRPRPTASPTAESAAARSWSASATRMASVEESSSAVPPPATIRSSAVRLSRTDPPPAATAWSTASPSMSSSASATTCRRCSDMIVGADQAELEYLAAAPDGVHHLVGLGGGQHPCHMVGGLLQGLEQRVLGSGGEHVDLVEQVHLGPSRRGEVDPFEEAPHVVDLVVGGGVELLKVERAALLDRQAGLADAAGLAVVAQVGAVERLGQHPGGGGLAAAPGAVQQVGVADLVGAHGRLQGPDHMVLTLDLGELLGPVAAVERLVGHRGRL